MQKKVIIIIIIIIIVFFAKFIIRLSHKSAEPIDWELQDSQNLTPTLPTHNFLSELIIIILLLF